MKPIRFIVISMSMLLTCLGQVRAQSPPLSDFLVQLDSSITLTVVVLASGSDEYGAFCNTLYPALKPFECNNLSTVSFEIEMGMGCRRRGEYLLPNRSLSSGRYWRLYHSVAANTEDVHGTGYRPR